jgi:hypothetical protein
MWLSGRRIQKFLKGIFLVNVHLEDRNGEGKIELRFLTELAMDLVQWWSLVGRSAVLNLAVYLSLG